jgi:hypothetical protein
MATYRAQATIVHDGKLTLEGMPFHPGDKVEVLVRGEESSKPGTKWYPLRGQPIRYDRPFESVAEDAWEAVR